VTVNSEARWEWRSCGRRFGHAEARLAQTAPGGVQVSDEIYLFSGDDNNVKVGNALMGIKRLRDSPPAAWCSGRRPRRPALCSTAPRSTDRSTSTARTASATAWGRALRRRNLQMLEPKDVDHH